MQNIDFYEGNTVKPLSPQFDSYDMEYFSRLSNNHLKEEERSRKRASRIIFIIGALCIISFTTGLIVGLKFAGGHNKVIVDDQTYNAVKNLQSKMSSFMTEQKHDISVNESFPVQEYPFVIKIGKEHSLDKSKIAASFLSGKGHTVIISKSNNGHINLYTGPYRSMDDAKISLNTISSYTDFINKEKLQILRRK